MNDRQNNQIDCFRTRLAFLDDAENTPRWFNLPPLKFTEKVALAHVRLTEITGMTGRQSLAITGSAADKDREETDLENTAYALARALVIFARDTDDETLAARYDLTLTDWRRLRDEQLLEKCSQLHADVKIASANPEAHAFGLTAAAVETLGRAIVDYGRFISAPTLNLDARKVLTASLPVLLRNLKTLFGQLDDLSLQFRGTPTGDKFVRNWLATARIIDRGKGPKEEPKPTPGPTP